MSDADMLACDGFEACLHVDMLNVAGVPDQHVLLCVRDGIFIKHRQGKSSDAETPFTRPRPIAETTFTPPRPIAQHPFFLQEIDRGDSFSNLRDRPRRLLFQHGSVISRN